MRGFRPQNVHLNPAFKENARRIVSREALGFVYAGFFGGLCGGVIGGFFAVGLGAFFF
jgi:hypothetical protein